MQLGDRRAALSFLVLAHRFANFPASGMARMDQPPKVSVHALSNSLVIPYETMRRSVNMLIKEGLCERDGRDSIVLCVNQKAQAAVARLRETMTEQFLMMLRALKAVGFDFQTTREAKRLPECSASDTAGQHPSRADLAHTSGALFLRLIEVGGPLHQHDYLRTLVLAAIVSSNMAHIAYDKALMWQFGAIANPPPDALRKAVSVRSISEMLGISVETTRRTVCQLIDDGECIRVGGQGVMVPAEVLARKELLQVATNIALRVDQALAELAHRRFDFTTLA
jgi:DNA-binding transcriptional regulator YhcF (GntR family)